jgi:hypothetical protein
MMKPKRLVDICFFLGFAGVMYATIYGTWKPDRPEYPLTLAALIFGVILILGSFIYLYREKRQADDYP